MKKLFSLLTVLVFSQLLAANSFAQTATLADADKLFDFAEQVDPGLFSPPAQTQQLNALGSDWFLRLFTNSEVFLVVNVNGTGPFFGGDVYALGGPFGDDPIFVDTLANLVAVIDALNADDDNDGIVNTQDQCPDTPSGESVNAQGCSDTELDDDNDGVNNALDQCPATPAGESVNGQGCGATQLDDDNDGVNNALDQCPATASGVPVNGEGCSAQQLGIVVALEDADKLFGFAQALDGATFGPAVDTQIVNELGVQWYVRTYSNSGISIKVSVNGMDNFPAGNVYVIGGPFGNAEVFIDTLANLVAVIDSLGPLDADNDGIGNDVDQCPATPSGESVNAQGCSATQLDDDNDGVNNALDQCPATPSGESVNAQGCSATQLDDDNDGVNNALDQCPATPVGESVNGDGCSESQLGGGDADNDGVSDGADQCPATPAGESVNAQGCSASQLDDDNDGVNNALDQCPATPAGEPVNAQGCSASQLDDDNDGVNNAVDLCPATPAGEAVNAQGCSASQLDDDFDGVNNALDVCPATPLGQAVNAQGCGASQLDDDNDGVSNAQDLCPDTPSGEAVDANGCSEAQNNTGSSQYILEPGSGSCVAIVLPAEGTIAEYRVTAQTEEGESELLYTEEWLTVTDTTLMTRSTQSLAIGPTVSNTVTETTQVYETTDGLIFLVESDSSVTTSIVINGVPFNQTVQNILITTDPLLFVSPADAYCVGMVLFTPSVSETTTFDPDLTLQGPITAILPPVTITVIAVDEAISVEAGSFTTYHLQAATEEGVVDTWIDTATGTMVKVELRDTEGELLGTTELITLE